MHIITLTLSALVVLEHLYIMFLETIVTSSKKTARTFNMAHDQLQRQVVRTLFKNQGVYNLLLAVLILIAILQEDLFWLRLLLGFVILVAAFGSSTSSKTIIIKQGGLAILALACSYLL